MLYWSNPALPLLQLTCEPIEQAQPQKVRQPMATGTPVGDRDLFIFHGALCSAAIFADIGTAVALALSGHYPGRDIVRAICYSQARSLVRILCPRRVALSRFVR